MPPAATVAVLGRNGAGKSTLLRALQGLLRPSGGTIRIRTPDGDADLAPLGPHRRAAAGIAYVPQVRSVFPNLAVQENLELGGTVRRDDARQRHSELLDAFPLLAERRRKRAGNLSRGQRQVLAIARALMADPVILLLDEPSGRLDPSVADLVFSHIAALNREGASVVLVEQNVRRAVDVADQVYILEHGRNRFDSPVADLRRDPQLLRRHLGLPG